MCLCKLLTFNDQSLSYRETSQLICSANQLTGFYMRETLVVKMLTSLINKVHENHHKTI